MLFVNIGVSISKNPSSARNWRTNVVTLLRIIRFFCKSGRRKSKKRYFNRSSSFVLLSASIGNGGVSDSESTRISFARNSIAPVSRFSFTAPERFDTVPFTATTNSLLSFSALANPSASISPSSKITCKIPDRSRTSTKIIPPLLRCFCTQPITVTSCPSFASLNSAHLQVRFNPFIDSAILSSIPKPQELFIFSYHTTNRNRNQGTILQTSGQQHLLCYYSQPIVDKFKEIKNIFPMKRFHYVRDIPSCRTI